MHQFISFCTKLRAVTKQSKMNPNHYETQQYVSLWSNGVGRVHSLRKIPKRLHGTNLCINCTSSTRFHRFSCSNETLPNAPKHYETHQNMSLWSNGVDRVRSLRKIPMRFRGTILCNISPVQPLCTEFRVVTKYCQIHPNTTRHQKHEFRVQWGGSGSFVAKNSDAISWHKLVH